MVELVRQKNQATKIVVPIIDKNGDPVSGAADRDAEYIGWSDTVAPGSFVNITDNTGSELGTTGRYEFDLSASEMNNDYIYIKITSTTANTLDQDILIRTIIGDPLNLATTTSGRTIDVEAGGTVGVDFSNINGTLDNAEIGDNLITAAKIATDAITSDKIAASAIGSSELADNAITAAKINAAAITNAKFAAGAIDANAIAADAIGSSEFAQAAADKVWSTATRALTDKVDFALTAADKLVIADNVWDEDIEAAHGGDASAGLLLRVLGAAISNRTFNATLNALLGVADTSGTDLPEQVWAETVRALTDKTNFQIASGGFPVGGYASGAITADAIATDAIGSAEFAQAAADKVWSTVTRTVTGGTIGTLTGHTPQTGDTYAQLPTNFSDLSITVTTGLVDITQGAADKVWSTAVRSLTDKAGFSISGVITTLDGLNNFDYTSENVTVGTNNDKTGYSISGTKQTLDALNDISQAEVNTQVDTALADIHLDHLVQTTGSVSDVSPSTTDFDTNLSEITDDHYQWQLIVFIEGALIGQSRFISAYDGTAKNITVSPALTEAPTNGDDFVIVDISRVPPTDGGTDWTSGERAQFRDALGVDGTKTAASGGQLQTIDSNVDDILTDTGTTLPATLATLATEANATTNKNGVITEINKPIIVPVCGSMPAWVTWDALRDHSIFLQVSLNNQNGGNISSGEITPGTVTIYRFRNQIQTAIISAQAATAGANSVYYVYTFTAADWAIDDAIVVQFSDISVTKDSRTVSIPTVSMASGISGDDAKAVTDAIDAKTTNLPGDPASETNVDANETKIDTLQGDVTAIRTKTDNLPADTATALTALATEHARLLGLTHENIWIEHTWTDSNHTSSSIEIYNSKANADAHDGSTGLVAAYTLTVTYSGNQAQNHLMTKDP